MPRVARGAGPDPSGGAEKVPTRLKTGKKRASGRGLDTPRSGGRDENGYYWLNGRKFVSVTTVLKVIAKPALVAWMVKQGAVNAKKIASDTADIGSQFHGFVDQLLKHQLGLGEFHWDNEAFQKNLGLSAKEVKPMLEQWRKWWPAFQQATNCRLIATELTVYSETYGYAGTLDCEVCREVLDWKTSSGIYDEMRLQVMAYSFARAEMNVRKHLTMSGVKEFDDGAVLHAIRNAVAEECRPKPIRIFNVSKKEPHEIKTWPKTNDIVPFSWAEFEVFVSALNIWKWLNRGR